MVVTWEYLAGFFDGEGTVCVPFGACFTPRVAMYQSGERGRIVLQAVQKFLIEQDMIFGTLESVQRDGKRKVSWMLTIRKRDDVQCFLTWILPYLIVKKVEAQDSLRYLKMFPRVPAHWFHKKFINRVVA